jgi:hypothetical protein
MYLKESRTSSDPVYSNPCLIIRSRAPKDGNLSFSCLETLREVLEDWGDAPYEHILDYTTRTIPYLSTFYREPIDWASIQPYSDLRYALSFPQRLQIHRFVKEPEKTVCQYSSHSESRVVSINEVAEIYLALCGNQPDKIPSRENLGFNLKTVLHALEKVRNKKEVGTEKYPAEIARAARLTDALLNSMSFRSYSSRVALEAGMLFLKKSGYSFDRDILEDHWPDGDSPEILKKWFRRMCEKVDTQ